MPFISKDWRSPGEEWVKTEEGWEKKKILECGKRFSFSQENLETSFELQDEEDKENMQVMVTSNRKNFDGAVQPHCHVVIKCTKEIAGFNGLSDALKRLDFRSAVHDVRRFHYICKLLDLLISQKLAALSGHAQKALFNMLEEVACQVSASQQNIHMLRQLVRQLTAMVDCACWGRPLGSTRLWQAHLATIDRILAIADRIEIRQPADELYPKLQNVPEECVREIMLRLDDHKDLQASGEAYSMMARLCGEQRIWRELCQFHFTRQQIVFTTEQMQRPYDWQQVFHKLRKSFGLREEYAEMIQLCRNCRCLFWKSIGHPCIADTDPDFQKQLGDVDKDSLYVPVPPQAFLKFFSL